MMGTELPRRLPWVCANVIAYWKHNVFKVHGCCQYLVFQAERNLGQFTWGLGIVCCLQLE